MNKQIVMIGAGAVLVGAALYAMRQRDEAVATSRADSVTPSNKGGLKTTPVKTSAVDFVAQPFAAITTTVRKLIAVPAGVLQDTFRLTPFGNPQSAQAAYEAPLRPDYRPSSYARDNIVFTEFGNKAAGV